MCRLSRKNKRHLVWARSICSAFLVLSSLIKIAAQTSTNYSRSNRTLCICVRFPFSRRTTMSTCSRYILALCCSPLQSRNPPRICRSGSKEPFERFLSLSREDYDGSRSNVSGFLGKSARSVPRRLSVPSPFDYGVSFSSPGSNASVILVEVRAGKKKIAKSLSQRARQRIIRRPWRSVLVETCCVC